MNMNQLSDEVSILNSVYVVDYIVIPLSLWYTSTILFMSTSMNMNEAIYIYSRRLVESDAETISYLHNASVGFSVYFNPSMHTSFNCTYDH